MTDAANPFDQFDAPPAANAFDQFDAPQMTGAARLPAMAASAVTKGALNTIGAIGTSQPGVDEFSGTPGASDDPGTYPDAAKVLTQGAANLGLVDRPDLQPQTRGERMVNAAGEGVGQSLPLLPITGPVGLAQGAGAGAGGQLGQELFPNHPILGSIFGSIFGGGIAGGGTTAVQRGVNAARGVTTDLTAAYDRLGIPTTLAGDVTGNPALQRTQAFAASAPMGGSVGVASKDAIDSFGNAVENTAAQLGKSRSAQDAGTALQAEARNWRDTVFPEKQTAAWTPVNDAIPWSAAVRPEAYRTALDFLSGKMADLPATKKVLLSSRSQQLLDAINEDVPAGAGMTWKAAQNLRSVIGEIRGVPEIADSIGDKELGRLYGALSNDMKTTANNYGVGKAFDAANKASTEGYAFQRNIISKVIKSNNPLQESVTPEQAANNILNSGDTVMQAVRQELPTGANEIAAYKLRDMALANAGKQGSAGEKISPTTFLSDYNTLRMRAPAGTRALYGGDPKVAQAMDDLATVAGRLKDTTEHVNVSRTGSYLTTKEIMGAPRDAAVAAAAGYAAGGLPAAVGSGLLALGGPFLPGYLGAQLTASPLLTRYMATPAAAIPRGARLATSLLSEQHQQPAPGGLLQAPDYR